MLNLITGTPGAGKTSYSMKFMLDQLKGSKRKIYVHGVPELKIPHERLYCDDPICEVCSEDPIEKHESVMVENWHEYVTPGSVVFIDESQYCFRPRSPTAKVPPNIKAFEVHRHKGLDFFFVTQHPKLIDGNIRRLVSRHIHLEANWLKRNQYEWPACKDDLSKGDAIKTGYKLDKKTFSLYKSASLHTKQERKVPVQVYVLFISLIMVMGLSFKAYSSYKAKGYTDEIPKEMKVTSTHTALAGGVLDTSLHEQEAIKETKQITYNDLQFLSYTGIKKEELRKVPGSCKPSYKSLHCTVPQSMASNFKSYYCKGTVCKALIPYQVAKDPETESVNL